MDLYHGGFFLSFSKCNPEMVELFPLSDKKDQDYVKQLLEEFVEKTGSLVAQDLLVTWPEPTTRFVKVFPYEYQRALKQMEENKLLEPVAITNGNSKPEAKIKDIEDSIADADMDQKKLDKIRQVRINIHAYFTWDSAFFTRLFTR